MRAEEISSRENKLLRHITRLASDGKYRRACGEYVCEGEKLLYEALRDGAELRTAVFEKNCLENADKAALEALTGGSCRLVSLGESLYKSISTLENYKGALFVCAIPETDTKAEPGQYLALEGVQDPGNVGTMIRVADAFGLDGLWLLEGCADPYQPKAVRAAMGSLFRTRLIRSGAEDFFTAMAAAETPVYAAALHKDSVRLNDLDLARAAVIIGSEGRGVSEETIDRCSKTVIIPMPGRAESLNAAIAGSIVMWEMSRCR